MDENRYLILDTQNGYKDLTADIVSIIPKGQYFEILFRGNSRPFFYSKKRIHIEQSPEIIESDIEINGRISLAVERKLRFGGFLKIYPGKNQHSELYAGDFKIHKTDMAAVLKYYYEVALQIKTFPPDDPTAPARSFVAEAISEIRSVKCGTPLFLYLTGTSQKTDKPASDFIFPFSCNESQLKAVEQTFSNRLSMIQGPPGTGKTQTILNIIMNALMKNKRVAVVSNNNAAIQNVLDKLKAAEGLDFTASLLGNKENQERFLKNQPEYPDWLKSHIILDPGIKTQLGKLQSEIRQLFTDQNRLRKKQTEKSNWVLESKKFSQCYPNIRNLPDNVFSSKDLLAILTRCNWYNIREKKLSFWFKFWNVFICHRWNFAFWNQPLPDVLAAIKKGFYQKKIFELEEEISQITKHLTDSCFEQKQQQLNQFSRQILKANLQKKYRNAKSKRRLFDKHELISPEFRSEYPVLLSTTFMIKRFAPENGFDLLVMDESSQVDLCTGIVALSCAKNAVIVGDDKQLPCVVTSQDERLLSELNAAAMIDKRYLYQPGRSILDSVQHIIPDVPRVILCEHYRCDPLIIGFCNKRFYDNQLVIHSKRHDKPSLRIVFTMPGNHARGHFNLRQAQEVDELKRQLIKAGYPEDSIGICTPYRIQAEFTGASTIHQFQGREKDVIIMCTVDNAISDFVADNQLVNVAVSRAKKEFYLIISSSNTAWNNCIGDLVNYIKYCDDSGMAITQGKITSVFDLLYQEYQNQSYQSGNQRCFFDSPAEKIVYDELVDILQKKDVDHRYSFKMHIPLKEFFKPDSDLSEQENAYLTNYCTHADFLIYERFGMTPRFVIEVDGYAYHKKGTLQAERDKLKNSIFQKRGFPLLRLSTIDSGERKRMIDFIFG